MSELELGDGVFSFGIWGFFAIVGILGIGKWCVQFWISWSFWSFLEFVDFLSFWSFGNWEMAKARAHMNCSFPTRINLLYK